MLMVQVFLLLQCVNAVGSDHSAKQLYGSERFLSGSRFGSDFSNGTGQASAHDLQTILFLLREILLFFCHLFTLKQLGLLKKPGFGFDHKVPDPTINVPVPTTTFRIRP
jgi:hypothetical protein